MKSIYRCSKYGFLNIADIICESGRTCIELAALCVNGVYGAALIVNDKKLHVIFNPQKTDLYKISSAVALIGYNTNLHQADKATYSLMPFYCLKLSVYYINSNAFIGSIIAGLDGRKKQSLLLYPSDVRRCRDA